MTSYAHNEIPEMRSATLWLFVYAAGVAVYILNSKIRMMGCNKPIVHEYLFTGDMDEGLSDI